MTCELSPSSTFLQIGNLPFVQLNHFNMKHLILVLFSGFCMHCCFSQKIKSSEVPDAVKTAFAKKYPAIKNTRWEIEDGAYEASFKDNIGAYSAMFSKDGTFTESESGIKANELPAGVLDYMKEHYKNAEIKETAKITKADGTVNFEAGIKGKDIIFDEQGAFIKEIKD